MSSSTSTTFRKARSGAPQGYFEWEAAGLRWLAEARPAGGPRVAEVLDVDETGLTLTRVEPGTPQPVTADALGRELAAMHAAGAPAYGSGPDGWSGDGFLGPLSEPLPLSLVPTATWGEFYGRHRVLSTCVLGRDRGTYGPEETRVFEALARRLSTGEFDDVDRPARLHGDLWSGNVMWTHDGAVLIDPAAHGGHPVTDLAMLAVFAAPYLERVLGAYAEAASLGPGWDAHLDLHQVHPLMMHAVLFGGGYVAESVRVARRYT